MFLLAAAAVMGLAGASFAQDTADASIRKWTSSGGQTVEAKFVKLESGTVYLEKADGSSVRIALTSLCADDQDMVNKLAGASADEPVAPVLSSSLSKGGDGTLSEEEIAGLKTETVDEKSGAKLQLSATFFQRPLHPEKDGAEIRKYSKSGKIPVRILVTLYEIRDGNKKRMDGRCHFYILDAQGKLLAKRTMSLEEMCPS